jgi:hypothetical protein
MRTSPARTMRRRRCISARRRIHRAGASPPLLPRRRVLTVVPVMAGVILAGCGEDRKQQVAPSPEVGGRVVLQSVKTDPLWLQLTAVQQGRVYEVPGYWIGSGILAANAVLDDLERYLVSR